MEYLRGEALATRLRREGAQQWRVVARVVDEILAALAVAHGAGVVHRDLKPENIDQVTDGGDARQASRFRRVEAAQLDDVRDDRRAPAGTPAYMAPGAGRRPVRFHRAEHGRAGRRRDRRRDGDRDHRVRRADDTGDLYRVCHGWSRARSCSCARTRRRAAGAPRADAAAGPDARLHDVEALRGELRAALSPVLGSTRIPTVLGVGDEEDTAGARIPSPRRAPSSPTPRSTEPLAVDSTAVTRDEAINAPGRESRRGAAAPRVAGRGRGARGRRGRRRWRRVRGCAAAPRTRRSRRHRWPLRTPRRLPRWQSPTPNRSRSSTRSSRKAPIAFTIATSEPPRRSSCRASACSA